MSTNRRTFIRTAGVAVLAAPFLAIRELTKPPTQDLPHVRAGELMRSSAWNELIDRVNLLSKQ